MSSRSLRPRPSRTPARRKEREVVSNRPIRRLRVTEDETGLVLDHGDALAQVAALPPALTTAPDDASQYLTVSLDWRPHGSDPSRRPARRQFEDAASAILAAYAKHTPAARSLAVDVERVARYLDNERVDRHLDIEPLSSPERTRTCSLRSRTRWQCRPRIRQAWPGS